MTAPQSTTVHATTIAFDGRGALLLGPSGSGKSATALQLIALGCTLVSDDQTTLTARDGRLEASAPRPIAGQIEARGFGILRADFTPQVRLVCAVALDQGETKRLPEPRYATYCGIELRLFHNPGKEVLPFAVLQYLKGQPLSSP